VAGIVFFVIAAFGTLIGVVYPWAAANQQSYELSRWQAVSESGGFASFETILPSNEDKVLVSVEIETAADVALPDGQVILTLTASRAGRTELAVAFDADNASPMTPVVASGNRRYALDGGALHFLDDEPFSFVFTSGEADVALASVELILVGGTYDYDEGVPPIGYGLMAVGFAGFGLTLRGRRPKAAPPPRWGRG